MARIASSDWLTTRGASWLCSKTSPATTTKSAPTSAASGPRPATRRGGRPNTEAAPPRRGSNGSSRVANRRCARIASRPLLPCRVFARHGECRSGRRQVGGPRSACAPATTSGLHRGAAVFRGGHRPKPTVGDLVCNSVGAVTNEFRTLLLLRHAKSDYPAGVVDHERPLAPRGEREAALAGDWLRAHTPAVDAVLCSTATRTRETLASTQIEAPVSYVDRLYDATPGAVIDEINGVDPTMWTPCWSSATSLRYHRWRSASPPRTAATRLRPSTSRRSSRHRRSRCCALRNRGTSSH